MSPRPALDLAAVDALLRRQERVVAHADLMALGMPRSSIGTRILPGGTWQRLHPGVVLAHTGTPTTRERLLGALAYAGPGAVVTGLSALRLWGVRTTLRTDAVHVAVPHTRRRQSQTGLLIERTRHLGAVQRGGLPIARVARALVDACRRLERLDDVRELVAGCIQTGACTVHELREAIDQAARQRTALVRAVLREVSAGVRSAAEARVRDVFTRHGIPQPRWNWALHRTDDGSHVVTPDGWWDHLGVALQIDSMAFHLTPASYKRTQRLQRRLGVHDVPFLPVAPADVFDDERGFVAQVRAFLTTHRDHRPPPGLQARPPAQR